VYAHRAALPRLQQTRAGDSLTLRWDTGADGPFPLAVEITVGGETRRMEMPEGGATFRVPFGAEIRVDPQGWLLR